MPNARGDFFPLGFPSRLQRARVICYVRRDTRIGERKRREKKKRERERENVISRPAGAWKIASFYKDTQIPSGRFVILVRWHGAAYGLGEIGYAVVAVVVALACRCSFIMVTSLIYPKLLILTWNISQKRQICFKQSSLCEKSISLNSCKTNSNCK